MCRWKWLKLKKIFQHKHLKQMKMNFSFFYFIVSFEVCLWTVFLWYSEKSNFKHTIFSRFDQRKIKSMWKDYVLWMTFKYWLMKNYKPIGVWFVYKITKNICCLHTFLQVHSNSNVVLYLVWQNKHSDLKTTCHMKPKRFL